MLGPVAIIEDAVSNRDALEGIRHIDVVCVPALRARVLSRSIPGGLQEAGLQQEEGLQKTDSPGMASAGEDS